MSIHKQCIHFTLAYVFLIFCNDICLMQYAWNFDVEGEDPTSIEKKDQPHYELVDDDLQHQGTLIL